MSLPDYSKQAQFYGLLNAVNHLTEQKTCDTEQIASYIHQIKSDNYVELYSELPLDIKTELDILANL